MNFSVEVAKSTTDNSEAQVIATMRTDSVLEFIQYVEEAVTYFEGMAKFDSNVTRVSLLIRCHNDHHVIIISNNEGMVTTRSEW